MRRAVAAAVLTAFVVSSQPSAAQDLFRSLFGFPPPWARQPKRIERDEPSRALPPPARVVPAPARLPTPRETAPPPYEGEMIRLAEVLGALHYLRPLCGASDGNRWRSEMQGLIEAEQPPDARKDRLIASFNQSYVAYEQTYRSCTPAAGLAIQRYLDEGARLSREIATKYGN